MILMMALACAFAALVCYSSCYVAARADEKSEKYWREKNGNNNNNVQNN